MSEPLNYDMTRCKSEECPRRDRCLRSLTTKIDPPFAYLSYADLWDGGDGCRMFVEAESELIDTLKARR